MLCQLSKNEQDIRLSYKVELAAGLKSFAEVEFQRGIFQGDELSPLLFVIKEGHLISFYGKTSEAKNL